jgi:hypothetical protein
MIKTKPDQRQVSIKMKIVYLLALLSSSVFPSPIHVEDDSITSHESPDAEMLPSRDSSLANTDLLDTIKSAGYDGVSEHDLEKKRWPSVSR